MAKAAKQAKLRPSKIIISEMSPTSTIGAIVPRSTSTSASSSLPTSPPGLLSMESSQPVATLKKTAVVTCSSHGSCSNINSNIINNNEVTNTRRLVVQQPMAVFGRKSERSAFTEHQPLSGQSSANSNVNGNTNAAVTAELLDQIRLNVNNRDTVLYAKYAALEQQQQQQQQHLFARLAVDEDSHIDGSTTVNSIVANESPMSNTSNTPNTITTNNTNALDINTNTNSNTMSNKHTMNSHGSNNSSRGASAQSPQNYRLNNGVLTPMKDMMSSIGSPMAN